MVEKKTNFTKWILGFMLLAWLFSFHSFQTWKYQIRGGDTLGYYIYLPATFIHNDLSTLDQSLQVSKDFGGSPGIGMTRLESGKTVGKYTIALSFLYAPFFIIAHLVSHLSSSDTQGFSFFYIYFILLSSIFYGFVGLILISKVLKNYFSDVVVAITILLLGLCTNLFYFTVVNSAMSHTYLFFMYAALIFCTEKWYKTEKTRFAIGVGLTAGMITAIRPTEIISILIPILWGIYSWQTFRERLQHFSKHIRAYLLSIGVFILSGIPQLIYWKYVTGQFFYYSYQEEGFDFANPKIYAGLLGFANGWLIYTPIMIFALVGIIFIFKKQKNYILPILTFLPIHIFVTYSWWCYNYINGFGSRPMVETYALLSIPLAAMITVLNSNKVLRIVSIPIFSFFIWLNIIQTYQIERGSVYNKCRKLGFL